MSSTVAEPHATAYRVCWRRRKSSGGRGRDCITTGYNTQTAPLLRLLESCGLWILLRSSVGIYGAEIKERHGIWTASADIRYYSLRYPRAY